MPVTPKQRRADLIQQAQAFCENHADDQGMLSKEDQAVFDSMIAAAESIQTLTTQAELDKNPRTVRDGKPQGKGLTFIDGNGRRVQALAPDEPIAEAADGPRVGEVVRGMITGNWGELDAGGQFASQTIGGADKGGIMLNEALSSQFIDLARSNSVLMKAGAQTIPMPAASRLTLARLDRDPTAYWRHETVAIQASDALFGAIHLYPQTLAALTPISLELAEDAPNAVAEIERAMTAAISLELDRAGLLGKASASGSRPTAGTPIGLVNESGINEVSGVGEPADYVEATSAIGKILNANYAGELTSLSWVAHPLDWQTYDGLTSSADEQPLQPTPWASKPRRLSTTSIPTTLGGGGNESLMLIGDFSEVLIGMRTTGVRIEVFDQGSATDEDGNTISAMAQMMKWIRAYIRVDTAVLRPAFFTKLTGVTRS